MTVDPYGQWMGTPMDDRAVADLLDRSGWGVLSLAEDDVPYSIPISFGYEDGRVYFAMIEDSPDSRKLSLASEGKTARLLVTDVKARFDWGSVSVTGPLQAVPDDSDEWDRLIESMADNAWFSSGFERATDAGDIHGWRLDAEEVQGLEVRPATG